MHLSIASESVKVRVITWPESAHAIRYAVVVETADDVGIWSGIYSNLLLLDPKKT